MKTRNSHGLLQLGREALAYCQCASALISRNKALLVSVDLIGEKNQVILELVIRNTGLDLNKTVEDDTKLSSCHTPHTLNVLHTTLADLGGGFTKKGHI